MEIKAIRGFNDILPDEIGKWQFVEKTAREVFEGFGFSEIRIPVLEKTELFSRGIGEATDIVEKEMYTFPDRSGESLTVRPEGTASVVRALLANRAVVGEGPVRLYYIGPMFRHERPQKGRLRQFHQLGAELFGSDAPYADAEVIALLHGFLHASGLSGVSLEINSLGDPSCRPAYNGRLSAFLAEREGELCDDCRRRRERNPLRALDCKSEKCLRATADAPSILDALCVPCREHFAAVESALASAGIPFSLNPRMVRGLDYYRRTAFEFVIPGMGAQNTVAAGGRYDGLAEMIGGRERLPAIGFAIGVERLLSLLGGGSGPDPREDVFLATTAPSLLPEAFRWKMALTGAGMRAGMDYEGRSLKSQFRRADRAGARVVLIFGEEEARRGAVVYRDMRKGTQEEVSKDEAMRRLCRPDKEE